MRQLLFAISGVFDLIGFIAALFIIVDAFQDELWKGLLSICCCFYLMYYGLCEFDHPYKWPIVLTTIGCPGIGLIFVGLIH
jgi:hypothetical protein